MKHLQRLAVTAFMISGLVPLSVDAAPITIGSLTFDDTAFIDTGAVVQGSLVGGSNSVNNMLGNNFGSGSGFFTNLRSNGASPSEIVQVGFTDNMLGNGIGNDFVIWEASIPQVPQISLSLGGTGVLGTLLERPLIPGSTNQMNAYVFDLSDLGVADDQKVTSLFIGPSGGESGVQILAAAALNSGGTVPPVPLPAGAALLLTATGAFGMYHRRRRA